MPLRSGIRRRPDFPSRIIMEDSHLLCQPRDNVRVLGNRLFCSPMSSPERWSAAVGNGSDEFTTGGRFAAMNAAGRARRRQMKRPCTFEVDSVLSNAGPDQPLGASVLPTVLRSIGLMPSFVAGDPGKKRKMRCFMASWSNIGSTNSMPTSAPLRGPFAMRSCPSLSSVARPLT